MKKQDEYKGELEAWLSGARRVAVVGVGNTMRGDDAVGVEVVKLLHGRGLSKTLLVEAETMPEDYIDQIAEFHPTHVLIIDSGLIGEAPGTARTLGLTKELNSPVSSHLLPLQILCAYLEKTIHAKILLLIVQPKDVELGERLSDELIDAAREIAGFLGTVLP